MRDAFARHGHQAYSCDLLDTERPGPHYRCDVRDVLWLGWDLMIAHPPCTYLARSGAHLWATRRPEQRHALDFVRLLLDAPIPRIALENPIGCISNRIRRPDQIVQPWHFGHGETKATCLWLKGLPLLQSTNNVEGREAAIIAMGQTKGRAMERSRTYVGMAEAMVEQWGVK